MTFFQLVAKYSKIHLLPTFVLTLFGWPTASVPLSCFSVFYSFTCFRYQVCIMSAERNETNVEKSVLLQNLEQVVFTKWKYVVG